MRFFRRAPSSRTPDYRLPSTFCINAIFYANLDLNRISYDIYFTCRPGSAERSRHSRSGEMEREIERGPAMPEFVFRRRDSAIDTYLSEIHGDTLITAADERRLALRMKKLASKNEAERRDALEARDQFVRANLRLVVSIARGFKDRGLPFNDLV